MRVGLCSLVCLVLLASPAQSADSDGLIAHWAFDESAGNSTLDASGHVDDTIDGNFKRLPGVRGNGVKFDGFTTRITRGKGAPRIEGPFTVQAWLAPQAYPWNWSAIVEHRHRYFFGLDASGHIGLHLSLDDQWREFISERTIAFMEWSHVAAVFDPRRGVALYINGEKAGEWAVGGNLPGRLLGRQTFQVGRNVEMRPSTALVRLNNAYPASYSFDGILDELRIYERTLTPEEIAQSYQSMKPATKPALTPRRLPRVPDGPRRFGAHYTRLKFYEEWDALWPLGEHPDVVVTFDNVNYSMVFWHGTNYNMNLVTENGRWIADQSAEGGGGKCGLSEHMSDKQDRYSHVRVIENHEARVVVHWRYAVADLCYNVVNPDPITGWGDWVDEYYTIYPDGIAVRHFVIHGHGDSYSITEPATLNNPGEKAEDNVEVKALTLANLEGVARTYSWDPWPGSGAIGAEFDNPVPGANVSIMNTKSRFKPVYVYEPGTKIIPYGGGLVELRSNYSRFPTWNHWPVNQIPSDGRYALAPDHVSSSAVSSPEPPMQRRAADGALEGRFIMGLSDQPIETAVALGRSWLQPPLLSISGDAFVSKGFDRNERAYKIHRVRQGDFKLELALQASEEAPLHNAAFLIEGWGESGVSVLVSGKILQPGNHVRVAHLRGIEETDLVVWINYESDAPVKIMIQPGSGGEK